MTTEASAVSLEAKSPYELRVHLGDGLPEQTVREALASGDMRDYPQMARIEAAITDRGIAVGADGMTSLDIDRPVFSDASLAHIAHVRLWRRSAPVTPVGAEPDAWFTRALGVRCRLMPRRRTATSIDSW